MRFLDEFRAAGPARKLLAALRREATRPWAVMEVCGGQTHTLLRSGIIDLLPPTVHLVHGPGCPVCVTPEADIDFVQAVAARPGVTVCSFGDMLRVPGTATDLLRVRAGGGDVRAVYSPLDAVRLAEQHPDRQVVFFAVGFETTAPATALAVRTAARRGLDNFSAVVAHVRVPPAMELILADPTNRVQAFLAAGHVCAITGEAEYHDLAARFRVPIVVTGFEPLDLLEGIWLTVRQLEAGRAEVENQYARAVPRDGNRAARELMLEVFEVADRKWRGVGSIPKSGLRLAHEYRAHDAERLFEVEALTTRESPLCISGQILRGVKKPSDCPAFGRQCTPRTPLGATMVSAEGACAAYFQYGRYLEADAGTPGST
jgi:hydrogenase expression/formation protein HypD